MESMAIRGTGYRGFCPEIRRQGFEVRILMRAESDFRLAVSRQEVVLRFKPADGW